MATTEEPADSSRSLARRLARPAQVIIALKDPDLAEVYGLGSRVTA